MKKKKAFKIIAIALIFCFFAVAGVVYFSLTNVPEHNVKIENEPDNNSYMNTCSNVMCNLARVGDKLYYNAANDFFKYGTYEITSDYTKRIYWKGPAITSECLDLNRVSNENIFSPYIHNDIVQYYDLNQKHYEEYLKLPDTNNDNASLEELFVVGNELYFSYSELYGGNVIGDTMVVYGFYNLYRQDEDDTKLILSVDNLDFDYISDLQFYDEYIYFVAGKRTSDKENASTNLFLCKYNPNNGKIVYKIPYATSSDFVEITCLSAVNDKVYGTIVNRSDNGYETVYCADLKSGTINTLFKSNAGMVINSYKDKVFLLIENGKDMGIYSVDTSTDKVTKIFDEDMDLNGLYIVDSKYLYFADDAYFTLHRITQDGKNLEKVFG